MEGLKRRSGRVRAISDLKMDGPGGRGIGLMVANGKSLMAYALIPVNSGKFHLFSKK